MASPVGAPGLAAEVAMFTPLVHDLFTARYSCIAAFTFLIYDYFLILGSEIEHFWKKGFTVGKVLFFFNRYFGIGLLALDLIVLFTRHTDPNVCMTYLHTHFVLNVLSLISVKCILVCRLHAVYGGNWRITSAFLVLICCTSAAGIIFDVMFTPTMNSIPFGFSGCYFSNLPHAFGFLWMPPVVSESILCLAMLGKALSIKLNNSTQRNSPLLKQIIRDSVLFFITNLTLYLTNAIIWTSSSSQGKIFSALWWVQAMPSVLGSHLLLNIRTSQPRNTAVPSGRRSFELIPRSKRMTSDFESQPVKSEGIIVTTTVDIHPY
ncbi:hypothetical protein M422DRAFT_29142 [Sphaerobolus stellatus SS14]|uniref:DUF6533 domain-containing protein n=1 Tax=Sphaerobolus stellatus (strain SS14) TaxID=990650 RepID=A0A0C9W4P2_SPHS4|nr:hypothetical protein M422DRAFT_29142 [Sphaerobolus stellatus SS14]